MTTMRVVGECFFWYRLTRVFPDKFHRAVKRLCCVVLCACVFVDCTLAVLLTYKLLCHFTSSSELQIRPTTVCYNTECISEPTLSWQNILQTVTCSGAWPEVLLWGLREWNLGMGRRPKYSESKAPRKFWNITLNSVYFGALWQILRALYQLITECIWGLTKIV